MKLKLATAACAILSAQAAYADTEYPLTLTSCGHEITLEAAPERVVSIGQGTTEILFMLGLEDRIAGTALWINPVLPEFAEANEGVNRISDNAPSFESVVEANPDLVITAYEWMIGEAGAVGTREQFDDAGVPTWLPATECEGKDNSESIDGARSELFSSELIYSSIETMAEIFDVSERGEEVIAELRAREEAAVAAAQALDLPEGTSGVFWYSSADLEIDPYVAGANGVPGWMLAQLGIQNVVESEEEWPTVGWETIARNNPTFIAAARMDRRRFPADEIDVKVEFLTTDPVLAVTDAIQNGRIIEIDAHAMDPSVRAIYALESLVEQLSAYELAE